MAAPTTDTTAKPAAPQNGVPAKPARFDNEPAYDHLREPGELILCILCDVKLILDQLHPSYMRSDIGDHMKRLDGRLSRIKKEFSGAKT